MLGVKYYRYLSKKHVLLKCMYVHTGIISLLELVWVQTAVYKNSIGFFINDFILLYFYKKIVSVPNNFHIMDRLRLLVQ